MTEPIKFDRSRINAYQKCPRKRWFEYHWQHRGLTAIKRYLALEAGGAIHAGLEQLLLGKDIEEAVEEAHRVYDLYGEASREAGKVVASGIDLTLYEGQDPQRVVDEHRAIVEALLRAFAAVGLQAFLATYEVVGIEKEVHEDFQMPPTAQTLRLMARIDVVVRRRVDGALFIVNFKTASMLGQKWTQEWQHDNQVITEVLAAKREFGPITGVLIYGLVKGRRQEYPIGSGNWYHGSPLAHAWHREGTSPTGGDEWSARYETNGKRLGKGWHKDSTWDNYPGGVKAWVEMLADTDPELLREQFVLLGPITRSPEDVAEWMRMTLPRELDIARAAEVVHNYEADGKLNLALNVLDSEFPKHTSGGNCVWPGRCNCYQLCWGAAAADPLNGGYELREPNHPAEFEVSEE